MDMGITKLKEGNNGTVIIGCESSEDMNKMKTIVQNELGDNIHFVQF